MAELSWFRFYARFVTDPDVEELSFDDQRHYVFLLCLKCNGLLDKEFPTSEKRERAIARRLGLQGEAFQFAKERLVESGLVDENWQPRSWDALQFKSDSAAERMRKYRAKKKELDPVTPALRNSYVLEQSRAEQNRTEAEQKKSPKKQKRAPKNFALDDSLKDFARSHGMTDAQIADEFAQLKDHEYKEARGDWPAAWRSWVRNWKKWNRSDQSDPEARVVYFK